MDKKDQAVLNIATKYVQDLRQAERPELWRDYWKLEAKILEKKRGK
jgi:hypothetical protein